MYNFDIWELNRVVRCRSVSVNNAVVEGCGTPREPIQGI
jgi:hypothetical protein